LFGGRLADDAALPAPVNIFMTAVCGFGEAAVYVLAAALGLAMILISLIELRYLR
jgi:hypothetical protein